MKKILLLVLLIPIGLAAQKSTKKASTEWYLFDSKNETRITKNSNHYDLLGLGENDALELTHSHKNRLNNNHIRYQQHYKGIPIEGAVLIIHKRNGLIHSGNGQLVKNLSIGIIPQITLKRARDLAIEHINAENYAWEFREMENMLKDIEKNQNASFYPKGNLMIYAPEFESITARLAYEFEIYALAPLERVRLFIDALTGDILSEINLIHYGDTLGNGYTKYNSLQNITCHHNPINGKYFLKETESRNIETRNRSSEFSPYWDLLNPIGHLYEHYNSNWEYKDRDALSVHWASEQWYDYFSITHNWNSYDNQGSKILNVVHYGDNMDNAFWNGSWINYGDGDGNNNAWTSLDMVAHEISHGLIQSTANLNYQGESGALNESFADIFAIMVERYALGDNNYNWIIGEDITNNGNGIRNMSDFMAYQGEGWGFGSNDHENVHNNSGVQNHWFYLLSNEIGIENAAEICFYSLRNYLTPYSNYQDAKTASIQAAIELFDQNTADIVCAKWNMVGVSEDCGTSQSITISNPEPNDILIINNPLSINWTTSGSISHVDIEYVIGSSSDWQTITHNTANSGSYTWNVPELDLNANIFIRVSNASNHSIMNMISGLSLQGCPVNTNFTGDNYTCIGNNILFNNLSQGANNYEWLLDGVVINDISTHLFWLADTFGLHELELRAYDATGCYGSSIQDIYVADSTNTAATFSYQKQGMNYLFTANHSDPNAEYTWSFGDGNMGEGMQFSHIYTMDSLFTVCLSVSNDCDTFQYCEELVIMSSDGEGGFCIDQWTHYTNGGAVKGFIETSNFIWIGTQGGLIRLSKVDGEMKSFNSLNSNLPDNNIQVILKDSSGYIWIGTNNGGLAKFNGIDWELFNTSNSGIPQNNITSLIEDDLGNIWIGTNDEGVAKYDGINWEIFDTSNSGITNNKIRSILEDSLGKIWIGTYGGGISNFDGINWEVLESIGFTLSTSYINSLLEDNDGNIWAMNFSFIGGEVAKYDGTNWEIFSLGLFSSQSLFLDNSGNVWATSLGGAHVFDGQNWTAFDTSNSGLTDAAIYSVMENDEGKIWLGSYYGEFVELDGTNWMIYATNNSNLPSNLVNTILKHSTGDAWIGTNEGIASYNGGDLQVLDDVNSNLSKPLVSVLMEDNSGSIWLGSHYVNGVGLMKFDGTNWESFDESNSGLPNDLIMSLLQDESGNIWIGTYNDGLVKFDGTNWEVLGFFNTELSFERVTSLLEDQSGNIWVGISTFGLAKYDGVNWEYFTESNSGLPSHGVSSLLEDNHNIWIGLSGGLVKFDTDNLTWETMNIYNSDLPSNKVTTLFKDSNDYIWVGTEGGVLRFNDTNSEVFNIFNSNLPNNTITSFSEELGEGNILVGTNGGLGILKVSVNPDFQKDLSCAKDTSSFYNNSYSTFQSEWQIDGETVSQEKNLHFYFEKPGLYEVTLIVSSSDGCMDVYREFITIPAAATDLMEHLPGNMSICGNNPAVINLEMYNYTSYEWRKDSLILNTSPVFTTTETGMYHLSVIDSCGGIATDSISVILDVDCVWAGDTDKNRIVNQRDLLSIGLAYGAIGNTRLEESTDWLGQAAIPWELNLLNSDTDYKHIDANGDGVIDTGDMDVINLNYGKSQPAFSDFITSESFYSSPYALVPKLEGINPNTQEIELSIELQSNEDLNLVFYGLAFRLEYEGVALFDTLFRPIILKPGITGEDAISIHRQFPQHTDIAFVGTNHQNREPIIFEEVGGIIEHSIVNFVIGQEDELPGGNNSNYLRIIPRGVLMINNVGDTIPIKGEELDIYILDDDYSFLATVIPPSCGAIGIATIFPTDNTDSYTYFWSTGDTAQSIPIPLASTYSVTITDSTGEIWEEEMDIEGVNQLDIQIIEHGTTLEVLVEGGNGDYQYFWNESEGESIFEMPDDIIDNLTLVVIDGEGCLAMETYQIPTSINVEESIREGFQILFPVPTMGNSLYLQYESLTKEQLDIEILDVGGVIVSSFQEDVFQGTNILNIDVKEFPKGIYVIRLSKNNSTESHRFTIIE